MQFDLKIKLNGKEVQISEGSLCLVLRMHCSGAMLQQIKLGLSIL